MTEAKQGHRYQFGGVDVIALESGPIVKVGILSRGEPWFVRKELVSAERLEPVPMKYYAGEVPRG